MAVLPPHERRPLPEMPPGYEVHVLGKRPTTGSGTGGGTGGVKSSSDDIPIKSGAQSSPGSPSAVPSFSYSNAFVGMPCSRCGRKFAPDRIEKHESVCKGAIPTLRKGEGAISKQYIKPMVEQELKSARSSYSSYFDDLYGYSSARSTSGQASSQHKGHNQCGNWRSKHEEFIRAIREAKQVQHYLKQGGDIRDLPPPTISEPDPSYIQCPYCLRRFNERAAERHIPHCATAIHRNRPPPSALKGFQSTGSAAAASTYRPATSRAPPVSPRLLRSLPKVCKHELEISHDRTPQHISQRSNSTWHQRTPPKKATKASEKEEPELSHYTFEGIFDDMKPGVDEVTRELDEYLAMRRSPTASLNEKLSEKHDRVPRSPPAPPPPSQLQRTSTGRTKTERMQRTPSKQSAPMDVENKESRVPTRPSTPSDYDPWDKYRAQASASILAAPQPHQLESLKQLRDPRFNTAAQRYQDLMEAKERKQRMEELKQERMKREEEMSRVARHQYEREQDSIPTARERSTDSRRQPVVSSRTPVRRAQTERRSSPLKSRSPTIENRPPWRGVLDDTGPSYGSSSGAARPAAWEVSANESRGGGALGSYSAIHKNPVRRALLQNGGRDQGDAFSFDPGSDRNTGWSAGATSSSEAYDPWAPVPKEKSMRARLYEDHYRQLDPQHSPFKAQRSQSLQSPQQSQQTSYSQGYSFGSPTVSTTNPIIPGSAYSRQPYASVSTSSPSGFASQHAGYGASLTPAAPATYTVHTNAVTSSYSTGGNYGSIPVYSVNQLTSQISQTPLGGSAGGITSSGGTFHGVRARLGSSSPYRGSADIF